MLAAVFAHEVPDSWAAAGIAVSCAGLTGVALWGLRGNRPNWAAIGAALATGLTIAAYTVVDGLGVRASGSSLGYIAWLMAVEGVAVPAYALYRWRGQLLGVLRPFAGVGLLGAALAAAGDWGSGSQAFAIPRGSPGAHLSDPGQPAAHRPVQRVAVDAAQQPTHRRLRRQAPLRE